MANLSVHERLRKPVHVLEIEVNLFQLFSSANRGAALLLSNSSPVARHVFDAAFDRQGHGRQLVSRFFT